MARRDTGTDDPRVRVRAGKGSRPRTKDRPDWSSKPGSVLDVQAMSSTVMPGVTRPRIAPKVAMR